MSDYADEIAERIVQTAYGPDQARDGAESTLRAVLDAADDQTAYDLLDLITQAAREGYALGYAAASN